MAEPMIEKYPNLTRAERRARTVRVAKSVDEVRKICAYLRWKFVNEPQHRTSVLLTELGLDRQMFDAVCYAMTAAGATIWPSPIDRS